MGNTQIMFGTLPDGRHHLACYENGQYVGKIEGLLFCHALLTH